MSLARRKDLAMLGLGALVVLFDQLTKAWIVSYFAGGRPPVQLLGQVLELQYLQNTGVAFSLFEGDALKFLLIAIALGVICYLYWKARETGTLLLKLSFGLILGGAISNLIDRFTHQYVVDFIHFQIPGRFDYPVFNIADCAICVGVVMLAILLWRSTLLAADEPTSTGEATRPVKSPASLANAAIGPRAVRARAGGSATASDAVTATPAAPRRDEVESVGESATAAPPSASGSSNGER